MPDRNVSVRTVSLNQKILESIETKREREIVVVQKKRDVVSISRLKCHIKGSEYREKGTYIK